jgi:flagellar basal body rod protein FlgG
MSNGIYSALSGAVANEQRVELLSHNMANANSTGFHGLLMSFETAKNTVPAKDMSFAAPAVIETDLSSGPLVSTGNPLDIALSDGVYIAVKNGQTDGYVEGGSFMPMPDGKLVTEEGFTVMGENKPLKLPADVKKVFINSDGMVIADGDEIGRMKLVKFTDRQALKNESGKFLTDTGSAGPVAVSESQPVIPGYLEKSNISVVKSMTDLIAAHRNFDATMKVVETFSHVEKKAATELVR